MRTVTEILCLFCRFKWLPRVANPAKCPKCGRRIKRGA